MENKHNSLNSKKRKTLIIHFINDIGDLNIFEISGKNNINIELSSFKDLSHLTLKKNLDNINCIIQTESYKGEFNITPTQENLNNLVLKTFELINLNYKSETNINIIDNKIEKFFNNKIKKVEEWNKKKDELIELSLSTSSLNSLPQKLLELSRFNTYLSSHIIIHSKGNLTATCLDYNKNYGFKRRKIDAKKFNTLFNLIKKSKNKSFNNILLKSIDLELVGSFLAKELELNKYNIIVIISRNDFLTPIKEEISYFNSFSKMLPKFLYHLLDSEKKNSETIYLLDSINSINIPIKITKNDGKEIFKNMEYERNSDQLENFEKYKIPNDLILNIYSTNDRDINSTDIFHFQRISLLGELLNTLRHELSNPLFGLKLAVDLFETFNLDEDNISLFKEISNSIERSQLIMENFTTLYSNKTTFLNISLKKLINETLTLTKSETKGLNKYIEYINIEELDELVININPTWFVQILFNLIINSAQALNQDKNKDSKNKFFKIIIEKIDRQIVIKVQDNGPGIKDITEDNLFKPFKTTKKTGTGLGLSISKNLARKMNGNLEYDKSYQDGACFNFIMPQENYENINN